MFYRALNTPLKAIEKQVLTLEAPASQKGQTHSNKLSAVSRRIV